MDFIENKADLFEHGSPTRETGTEEINLLSFYALEASAEKTVPGFYHRVWWASLLIGVAPLLVMLADTVFHLVGIRSIVYIYLSAASFSIFITNKIAKREWEEKYVTSERERLLRQLAGW